MSSSPLPGIILAAGRSQRMGKNKLLLPFRNKPILQHVLDTALNSSLSPLILVLGPDSDLLHSGITPGSALVVENPDAANGYSSSLQAGLRALDSSPDGAMFLLGDQPLVKAATIETLIQAFQQEPERWIAPAWKGQRGNPVITPASWFDKIFALTGDTGPRRHLTDPAAMLKIMEVADRGVVFDIDNPADYQLLKADQQAAVPLGTARQ